MLPNNIFYKLCQFKHLALGIGIFLSAFSICAKTPIYTFGIVPQQSATKLAKKWMPILHHIKIETGITLRFITAPSIGEFEQRLIKGQYDLAYANPLQYVNAAESFGYQAFAKVSDRLIRGIIVVRKDSPINDLKQLANQEIAFPSPTAFAASLLIKAQLKQADIKYTPKYVQSHDSVYHNILHGNVAAGGGIRRTLNNFDSDLRSQLRILSETDGYTPHAFAVHPAIPLAHMRAIQAAMVKMSKAKEGKRLLDTISVQEIEPAENSEWDDIRQLKLRLEKSS